MSHQGDCFTLPNLNPLAGLAAVFSNRVLILLKQGNRYMLELTMVIKQPSEVLQKHLLVN